MTIGREFDSVRLRPLVAPNRNLFEDDGWYTREALERCAALIPLGGQR